MTDTLKYSLSDSVGTLLINREEKHNALGAAELSSLPELLQAIEQDDEVRVLVVTGSGNKTFCAGASLDDLNAGRITPNQFQEAMECLSAVSIPTIAAINGNVFGGGVELALSCDFRLGTEGMRLRVPAAAFGLCYPPAGIARFVSKLGASAARRMLVASETLYGEELMRLQFLDYLVAQDRLSERTEELALHIAGLAPLATRAMKKLVSLAERGEMDMLQAEELVARCADSDDLQEGLAAQMDKRAPHFVGR
ncbi:MAG: enoyl-CoA hydratase/carnithine racemase [Halieaceae bacterium]|jgi:enoyl-CoA hydratase/carnithine racemase